MDKYVRPLDEIVGFIVPREQTIAQLSKETGNAEEATKRYARLSKSYCEILAADLGSAATHDPLDFLILVDAVHSTILGYGLQKRDLGGYYVNHAFEVAKKVSSEGADLTTIMLALWHDEPELRLSSARAQAPDASENQVLSTLIDERAKSAEQDLAQLGAPARYLASVALVAKGLEYVTGMTDMQKYKMIARPFEPGDTGVERSAAAKSIAVKYADRLINSGDLAAPAEGIPRRRLYEPEITLDEVEHLWQGLNWLKLPFTHAVNRIVPAEQRTSLDGARKLKNLYKNALLVHMRRTHPESARGSPEEGMILRLEDELLQVSWEKAREQAEHLVSYFVNPFLAYRALKEAETYLRREGFHHLTEQASWSKFDGHIKHYLDPILQGDKQVTEAVLTNKATQLYATLTFMKLFEIFAQDKDYVLPGVSSNGLAAASPAMAPERRGLASLLSNAGNLLRSPVYSLRDSYTLLTK